MKKLVWLASSRKDLLMFGKEVRQEIGYALYCAQQGERHYKVKLFKGCGRGGVHEIALAHDGDAYRAIYLLNMKEVVYVVHCFQKKSKRGIKTPREEINVIKERIQCLRAELKKIK